MELIEIPPDLVAQDGVNVSFSEACHLSKSKYLMTVSVVSRTPNHQIRFDDGIFFLLSLITTLFNHGSQLDANQLVNIFLPYSKNPDIELGRQCTIQPAHAYLNTMLSTLRFVYAMSKRVNNIMKDANETLGHLDVCQGKALFEVISGYDVNSRKGRNEF